MKIAQKCRKKPESISRVLQRFRDKASENFSENLRACATAQSGSIAHLAIAGL